MIPRALSLRYLGNRTRVPQPYQAVVYQLNLQKVAPPKDTVAHLLFLRQSLRNPQKIALQTSLRMALQTRHSSIKQTRDHRNTFGIHRRTKTASPRCFHQGSSPTKPGCQRPWSLKPRARRKTLFRPTNILEQSHVQNADSKDHRVSSLLVNGRKKSALVDVSCVYRKQSSGRRAA